MTTAAYANKRTIIDRLGNFVGPGQLLDGVQVEYAYPAAPTNTLIYGGRVSFEQAGDQDVADGDDLAVYDVATIWLYVRVSRATSVRDAETRAESIGDVLGSIISAEPRMCGPNTTIRIAGGTGDWENDDSGSAAALAYRITTTGYVKE